MKALLGGLGLCLGLLGSSAHARTWVLADMDTEYREHLRYIVPLLQKFMADPQTRDVAKMQAAQLEEALLANTAMTLAYESLVLQTRGEVCGSALSNGLAALLKQPDGIKGPVMFHPGTLRYVNAQFFRDVCTSYKTSPTTVSDLYSQQMAQIKAYTGGVKATSF